MRAGIRAVGAAVLLATVAACGSAPARPAAGPHATVTAGGATVDRPASRAPVRAVSPRLDVGDRAWVAVSVARLWESPSSPWPVDAPALRSPVRFRMWLRHMTLDQRRALDVRSDTEALLGDRVVVVGLRPHWARVVVPSQPSQKAPRGYPGWIPRRQLTARAPTHTAHVTTVTSRTAWLRTDDAHAVRTTEVSFGTRLHVLGRIGHYLRVVTPRGAARRLFEGAAVVRRPREAALVVSRRGLSRTAKSFLGLPYLWGGLSGFGLDCSGLTWLDYRVHGIRIPRDALPQSRRGRRTSAPGVGDLLFYASNGLVHHVSMYLGHGRMIHAPRTGEAVQVVPFSQQPLRSEYAGARRYLP